MFEFYTQSNDCISFKIDNVNNKPFYSINQQSPYNTFCFYSGFNKQDAIDLYYNLLLAFEDLQSAENFLTNIKKLTKLED